MSRGRVLVVDDDRFSREMLDEGLTLRGFSVTTSHSIASAMQRVHSEPGLSVVLTDLRLAGEDGLELCRQVCLSRPHCP